MKARRALLQYGMRRVLDANESESNRAETAAMFDEAVSPPCLQQRRRRRKSKVQGHWMCGYELVDKAADTNVSMQPQRIVGIAHEVS